MREFHCCYIDPETGEGCSAPALWAIYNGKPDEDTHACSAHVGALLTDADEHRVYPIETVVSP